MFNLDVIRSRTLPLLINGVAVQTDKVYLFPGSYVLTTGSKFARYGSGTLLLKHPAEYANTLELRPELTEAGEDAFIDAAKAKLTSCLKERKLQPTGCPYFRLRELSGQDLDEKTIKRTLEKDPWSNAEPRLDYQNPAIVEVSVSVTWSATARGRQNGRSATFETSNVYEYVTARATVTDDPLKVVFGR